MTDPARLISVCLAVRNQAQLVGYTLESIRKQRLPEGYELEVVATDDGSEDDTARVLQSYPGLKYLYIENRAYRNGVFAKNSSMGNARGDIVIQQSADVVHPTPDVIARLVDALPGNRATFAEVHNWHPDTGEIEAFQYTGQSNKRPFFFLGACYREDVCKIGGYDPKLGNVVYYDDNWHADCLIHTCHVKPAFLDVVAYHQHHERPVYETKEARVIYKTLCREALMGRRPYTSSAGPWPYVPGKPVAEIMPFFMEMQV